MNSELFSLLNKTSHFHDWYVVNIQMGNTGREILKYSKRGLQTVQITFATANYDVSYTLVFTNVTLLNIQCKSEPTRHHYVFTGFERVQDMSIKEEEGKIQLSFSFESESNIEIMCEKIIYRKNQESIW